MFISLQSERVHKVITVVKTHDNVHILLPEIHEWLHSINNVFHGIKDNNKGANLKGKCELNARAYIEAPACEIARPVKYSLFVKKPKKKQVPLRKCVYPV